MVARAEMLALGPPTWIFQPDITGFLRKPKPNTLRRSRSTKNALIYPKYGPSSTKYDAGSRTVYTVNDSPDFRTYNSHTIIRGKTLRFGWMFFFFFLDEFTKEHNIQMGQQNARNLRV